MARTTKFDVPVATKDATPERPKYMDPQLWDNTYHPKAGDVPKFCPSRSASEADFGVTSWSTISLPIEWKPNWTFRLALKFEHIAGNNSNITVSLRDQQTNKIYYVRPDTFRTMMEKSTWVYGVVVEDWTWEKSGRYIFLCPAYLKTT